MIRKINLPYSSNSTSDYHDSEISNTCAPSSHGEEAGMEALHIGIKKY